MAGRTYRYFEGEPLFRFGHGLSYTSFVYSRLKVAKSVKVGTTFRVRVEVENVGKVAGDEVVQLYIKHRAASVPVPLRSLAGFKRMRLKPGEARGVTFTVSPRQLSVIDNEWKRVVEAGDFEITVGGGQPGTRGSSGSVLSAVVKVSGDRFFVK